MAAVLLSLLLLGLLRECGAVWCWVGKADCFPPAVSEEADAPETQCKVPISSPTCFFDNSSSGAWTCPGRSLEECGGAADCASSLYVMGTVSAEGVPTVKANHADFKRCRKPLWPDGADPWYIGDDFHTATGAETDCVQPIYGELVECAGACVLEVRIPQNSLYGKTPIWGFERAQHRYCAAEEAQCVPTNVLTEVTVPVNGTNGSTVTHNVSSPNPLDFHLGDRNTGFARHCCKEDFCNAAAALGGGAAQGATLLSALSALLLVLGAVR